MSRYGDHTPKQELWELMEVMVDFEHKLTWGQLVMLLAEIIADILHYQLGTKEL